MDMVQFADRRVQAKSPPSSPTAAPRGGRQAQGEEEKGEEETLGAAREDGVRRRGRMGGRWPGARSPPIPAERTGGGARRGGAEGSGRGVPLWAGRAEVGGARGCGGARR